ncbi:Na+/H+ antiporter NhaA [Falsarthrobacter nasiphocae]|uniref:Na(+)/H(+) antiporter NhaA n=1 Tax=Falsarthrobacter nasiphocae TaxID=189863 RepID=A0AAE3YG04_9MICC|nr:Na+/H+ antiporter NhaA [Falsarthrobacter nasiphocae]MDR6891469.1 NhaA family Na+:H+ antiporter [Falsarthrobacter nasiphocae]
MNTPTPHSSPAPEAADSERPVVFGPGSPAETRRIGDLLRAETTSGVLLIVAAVIAVIWANSPWAESYTALRDYRFGPEALHLNLTVGHWTADGLLAIFFFLVGLELKREIVAGDLRSPSKALVPVAAAAGGVIVPALVYLAVNSGNPAGLRGWAIPTATDIAFAVAVLAIVGKGLPNPLRIFLLTLAVVDDLIAIVIIAVAYTSEIHWGPLLFALLPIGVFAFLVHRRPDLFGRQRRWAWVMLLPLAVVAWALVHASGIHATIAGVVLGLIVPVSGRFGVELAEILEHRFRPLSVGFAVPLFALFSAGVTVGGLEGLAKAATDPVALGIVLALVVGKPVGIVGTTWAVTRFTSASLDRSVRWADVVGIGGLAGIGFTVSLLVTELSFAPTVAAHDDAKVAVLAASTIAALVFGAFLAARSRWHTRRAESDDAAGA